jgi:hypothetical protein
MADTKHVHGTAPIEGDGVNYSGIGWFIVILTLTTVFCQLLVWGAFELMDWRVARAEAPRAPLAAEAGRPVIEGGRVVSGTSESPQPALLVDEPTALRAFRTTEGDALSSYAWVDQNAGIVRIPIGRAKDLVIERGLPARPGTVAPDAPRPAAARAPVAPAPAPAAPAATGGH